RRAAIGSFASNISEVWHPFSPNRIRFTPSIFLDTVIRRSIRARASMSPISDKAARKVLAGWRSWTKAQDQYRGISAAVTLIYGDSDWSRPNERERTRALIPHARLVTRKDTGHFSAVENPSELARIILE